MQASKIKPDVVYAIRRDGQLDRFRAAAVVTRRERATGSPRDYTSSVEGVIVVNDRSRSGAVLAPRPEQILGPYLEYSELMAREDAGKAERQRRNQLRRDAQLELLRELYRLAGLPLPNDPKLYTNPIRLGLDSVDITDKAIDALLAALQERDAA